MISRRTVLGAALAVPAIARTARAGTRLSIGYQKIGQLLVLKGQQTLETQLGKQGVEVSWHEFPSGPPLMEALNAGALDFGYAGDSPPIFALAAGADIVFVAYQPAPGQSSAVLVHKDGGIRQLSDLKGKRVAFTKGSSAHHVILNVLKAGGLTSADITPAYLQPADAALAFRQGAVDAWSIWDPYFAIAEQDPQTQVLTTAVGVAPSNSFFLAGRSYAARNPAIITAVIEEITRVTTYIGRHQDELARLMAEVTGISEPIERIAVARGNYETAYLNREVVVQEQAIADQFSENHVIPHAIRISDAVWSPSA
ncbi:MAG TPA: aliphatic sulfonate ABC transporter substrate-binding protein [Acidisphaera sp.]|nr:aliphatic sulfonate ABC transporter substrate-binding protein [Acidisphaera sp.]